MCQLECCRIGGKVNSSLQAEKILELTYVIGKGSSRPWKCANFPITSICVIVCVGSQESEGSPEKAGQEPDPSHLHRLRNTAAKLFQLNQAIRELHSSLSVALRGALTLKSSDK